MKGPILGILTIFFLQLGFVAYQGAEATLNLAYTPINPIRSPRLAVADLNEIDDLDTTVETISGSRDDISEPGISARPSTAAFARRTNKKIRPTFEPDRQASSDVFTATVITYRKPAESRIKSEPKPVELPGPLPESPKRSFLSKTAGVIKKPYKWIKSVGSAFN